MEIAPLAGSSVAATSWTTPSASWVNEASRLARWVWPLMVW
jgi:hypothetical protein